MWTSWLQVMLGGEGEWGCEGRRGLWGGWGGRGVGSDVSQCNISAGCGGSRRGKGEGEGVRMRGTGVLERLKNRLYRSSRTLITQK